MKRGDMYLADMSLSMNADPDTMKPVVIIQNDIGNRFSPTVIVAATTEIEHAILPTHVELGNGLVVLTEQIRTIDKRRLQSKVSELSECLVEQLNFSLEISLGL